MQVPDSETDGSVSPKRTHIEEHNRNPESLDQFAAPPTKPRYALKLQLRKEMVLLPMLGRLGEMLKLSCKQGNAYSLAAESVAFNLLGSIYSYHDSKG